MFPRTSWSGFVALAGAICAAAAGVAVAFAPLYGLLAVLDLMMVAGLAVLAVRATGKASVVLFALSFLCRRPMLFGERFSLLSIAFAVGAMILVLPRGGDLGAERSSASVLAWATALSLWHQPPGSLSTAQQRQSEHPEA